MWYQNMSKRFFYFVRMHASNTGCQDHTMHSSCVVKLDGNMMVGF